MPHVLSRGLRPRTLSGLYGQQKLAASIREHMKTRPPQAWLFHGGTGTGKTTVARILAVSFQCTHQQLWGDPCKACWAARNSFAIHEINASEASGVEEMGKVASMSRVRPIDSPKRVFILDEFQRATSAAQNLLLKPMEEPPPTTIWIVCTTDPQKILATLRRRCTTYQLKSLGFDGSEKFLKRSADLAKITKPLTPLYEQIHLAGIFSPALLLQALEKFAAGSTAEEAVSGADGSGTNSLAICKAVTSGDWRTLKTSLMAANPEETRWLRASVSGWIRGVMNREANPKILDVCATSLIELADNPIDDATMLYWLWGTLYRVCKRFQAHQAQH